MREMGTVVVEFGDPVPSGQPELGKVWLHRCQPLITTQFSPVNGQSEPAGITATVLDMLAGRQQPAQVVADTKPDIYGDRGGRLNVFLKESFDNVDTARLNSFNANKAVRRLVDCGSG